MSATKWTLLVLGLLLASPFALAQDAAPEENETTGEGGDAATGPIDVDVEEGADEDPEEAVGGFGTASVLVLVVVAVLVIALIVALANRR